MKLVLFGSIAGVGKTTLLAWLEAKLRGKIKLLDPGELFRRYHYREKLKTTEEIEELIVSMLENMPDDFIVVVHWHYAVRRPSGYIPQIAFPRLKRIAESGKIEQVVLVVIEAPTDVVLERRLAESGAKKRPLSLSCVREEVVREEEYLLRHQALFSEALGDEKVTVLRLINTDLEAAKLLLSDLFKLLVGVS